MRVWRAVDWIGPGAISPPAPLTPTSSNKPSSLLCNVVPDGRRTFLVWLRKRNHRCGLRTQVSHHTLMGHPKPWSVPKGRACSLGDRGASGMHRRSTHGASGTHPEHILLIIPVWEPPTVAPTINESLPRICDHCYTPTLCMDVCAAVWLGALCPHIIKALFGSFAIRRLPG